MVLKIEEVLPGKSVVVTCFSWISLDVSSEVRFGPRQTLSGSYQHLPPRFQSHLWFNPLWLSPRSAEHPLQNTTGRWNQPEGGPLSAHLALLGWHPFDSSRSKHRNKHWMLNKSLFSYKNKLVQLLISSTLLWRLVLQNQPHSKGRHFCTIISL